MRTDEEILVDLMAIDEAEADARRFMALWRIMAAEHNVLPVESQQDPLPAVIMPMATDDPEVKARIDAWLAEGVKISKIVNP